MKDMSLHLSEAQIESLASKIASAIVKGLREHAEEELNSKSVQIINAEGTSDDEHPENTTTWKDYWEKKTGKQLDEILPKKGNKYRCPTYTHHKEGDDGYVSARQICGCHVQIVGGDKKQERNRMYITPMCSGCNQRKDIFKLPINALVPLKRGK